MIGEPERAELLELARRAIGSSVGLGAAPTPAAEQLERYAAAFVTLHTGGHLRGCIGHVKADRPLADVVVSCAIAAASADPRFPPVTAGEVGDLDIEVSVLGPFEPVHSSADIDVGRHGLLIESGSRRGLLLPQVAVEWGWNTEDFIAQTCRKAGLPRDAWPSRGARLYRFEAEVFGDAPTP